MIIASSLSPNHLSDQSTCVDSWESFGKIFCFQHPSEIESLKSDYDNVKFIPTNHTIDGLIGKNLVTINTMMDYAIEKKSDLFIVNSDIFISDFPECKEDGITIFQRKDYVNTHKDGVPFENGWDGFYIPYQFLGIFPPSIYAMGACWWDYWIPYRAMRNSIPIYQKKGFAFHKKHDLQWNSNEWKFFAEYFRLENKLSFQTAPQMGTFVLQTIKNNLK